MTTLSASMPLPPAEQDSPKRAARFPGLRALAWSGDQLFASCRYQLLGARIVDPSKEVIWQPVASFRPRWADRFVVRSRLGARLFRSGLHALAVLPSGGMVAAVAGAIVTLAPNAEEFRVTHRVRRGTRPLHVIGVPDGTVYWGEYFDNPARDEVHIYGSYDSGATWEVAYTFPKASIRHVHNIVYDAGEKCLWVLTGDYGAECRILRAACDFSRVESVLAGNQQARAVALVPMEDGLYFASDTPLEQNFIYRLGRGGLMRLAAISGSSLYGCRVGTGIYFASMVEPSEINRDRHVRIYGNGQPNWQPLLAWQKDRWPMRWFQYGNAIFPDGNNTTRYLAVTTIAVRPDDVTTSLYGLNT